MAIFLILFIILFSFLAWRHLDWAVLLVVATLPSYMIRFNVLGLPMTALETMILIVFAVWCVTNYKELKTNIANTFRKHKDGLIRTDYPFKWEMIFLLIISFVAVGVAGFNSSALGIWKAYFFEPMLFYVVVVNVFRNNANDANQMRMTRILWAFAVSAMAVSLLAVYQKITGQFIYNDLWAAAATRRVVSFFGYPNAVGLYLGPLVLLFVGWLISTIKNKCRWSFCHSRESGNPEVSAPIVDSRFRGNDKDKTFYFLKIFFISITIFLSLLSIYFAKSKGAMLGVGAGLIVFALLAGKKIRIATIIILALAALGIALYSPARNIAIKQLTLNDFSGQVRKLQWSETWRMLKDGRIITGAGLSGYQTALKPYHVDGFFFNKDNDPDFRRKIVIFDEKYKSKYWQPLEIYMYPHNILLNFWVELGLAGVILFVWIIIKFFRILISNFQFPISKQFPISNFQFIKLGLICAMVVIIVHGLVDVPYFKNDLAVMFWIFLAMASIIKLGEKA